MTNRWHDRRVWPRVAICLGAAAASACLASPPGAIRGDGGGDADGGSQLVDCPPSPDYYGGAAGSIDGDGARDDIVLLAGAGVDGGIEFRLSEQDFERRCLELPGLLPRGAAVADLTSAFAGDEILVLAFTAGGDRRGLFFSTESGEPRLVATLEMGPDVHFSSPQTIRMVAALGDRGWFFAYGQGYAAVSSPFTGELDELAWHDLRDTGGQPLAAVVSLALHPQGDDVWVFAADQGLAAWYDTSELPASGPIDAEAEAIVDPPLEGAAFADLLLADGDECPDLLGVRDDTESAYKIIRWRDIVCNPLPLFGLEDAFTPAIGTTSESLLLMTSAQTDPEDQPDLVFAFRDGADRLMRGMRDARLDEVAGRECGSEDAVVEACADTAEELPSALTSDVVSAIAVDQDGDGEEEVLLVGEAGASSCYELSAGDWQTCVP